MNLKRKLWWAQNKSKVYKYGTILSLVLIVTVSVIYFTYSKFTSKNEATAYETTVQPFIKNDYFIASYIDGEWSNDIPGKNDDYMVSKIVCDNGATATWDNTEWGINIRNATKKTKCSVYFVPKPIPIIEKVNKAYLANKSSFATDDPDSNIRYIGADPNNYVYFNCKDNNNPSADTCEKWRIIGIFKNVNKSSNSTEDLVKIIRKDFIEYIAWDSTWNNNWPTASLQNTFNGDYYNGTYTTGALKNNAVRNAIESVVWNLGGTSYEYYSSNGLPKHWYSYERGTTVYGENSTTWTGKIALMYPSDYGYATSGSSEVNRATCLAESLDNWSRGAISECYNNDYLYGSGYSQWTLTTNTTDANYAFSISSEGPIYTASARDESYSARPVLYLKSRVVVVNGDGTSNNPYQIKNPIMFKANLHGDEYTITAEEGMTWEEFINSSYNDGNFEIIDGTILYSSFKNTDGSVSSSSTINNGETYSFSERYGG
mgnify:FL=1